MMCVKLFSFGAAAAPTASVGGGLFGTTPAAPTPAHADGLFGAASATGGGGLFGAKTTAATPAATPAAGWCVMFYHSVEYNK